MATDNEKKYSLTSWQMRFVTIPIDLTLRGSGGGNPLLTPPLNKRQKVIID